MYSPLAGSPRIEPTRGRISVKKTKNRRPPISRSIEHAAGLLQTANSLVRQVLVSVLYERTNIGGASAGNPSVGEQDVGYDALIDEMQALLNQQQEAATSQSRCWDRFVADTEGIREFLAEKRKKGQALSQQDRLWIGQRLEGALEKYSKCMTLPRPKRRPGGIAGG